MAESIWMGRIETFSCGESLFQTSSCLLASDMLFGDTKTSLKYACLGAQSNPVIMECHTVVFLAKILAKLFCSSLRNFKYSLISGAELSPWKPSQLSQQLLMCHPLQSVCPCLCCHLVKHGDEGELCVFSWHRTAATHSSPLHSVNYFVSFNCL